MPLFQMKSMSKGHDLENASDDYRSSKRVEQYRISEQALYFSGIPSSKYLPFAALNRIWVKKTSISPKGCCGSQLPMFCIRLHYDGEFYQNLLFEKQANTDKVVDCILACRPDLPVERETAANS